MIASFSGSVCCRCFHNTVLLGLAEGEDDMRSRNPCPKVSCRVRSLWGWPLVITMLRVPSSLSVEFLHKMPHVLCYFFVVKSHCSMPRRLPLPLVITPLNAPSSVSIVGHHDAPCPVVLSVGGSLYHNGLSSPLVVCQIAILHVPSALSVASHHNVPRPRRLPLGRTTLLSGAVWGVIGRLASAPILPSTPAVS